MTRSDMVSPQGRRIVYASALAVVAALGLAVSVYYAFPTPTYTVNGLTCPFPQGLPPSLQSVVTEVVQSTRFISVTNGQPFVLQDWGNMTYGNPTTQLPAALGIGFATYGSGTSCGETGRFVNWIDVQIPILNGTYDVAGESVHQVGGSK